MLDFSASLGPEFARMKKLDGDREADRLRWHRQLREISHTGTPAHERRPRLFGDSESRRRHALFARALEGAHREGITVDAWFGYKFADPELSARAEWAGLIDDAAKSAKDVWAA
jgi:hypothetical protein